MSQDQIDALVARLASDPAFATSLKAATTTEDVQRIAAEHGFDVTTGELASATSDGDLSDDDLAAVSGSGLDSPLAQLLDTLDISWG
ncbi:MAG: Nif11-like leader peptide family natural product precursor [Actinobacteria bacterium]|nr:Nif11-like leader peptide family natural product precursor [Actinomycetota bacterium]